MTTVDKATSSLTIVLGLVALGVAWAEGEPNTAVWAGLTAYWAFSYLRK